MHNHRSLYVLIIVCPLKLFNIVAVLEEQNLMDPFSSELTVAKGSH